MLGSDPRLIERVDDRCDLFCELESNQIAGQVVNPKDGGLKLIWTKDLQKSTFGHAASSKAI